MALKITITGKVRGVGYRAFLLEEADSLLIPKFEARNVKINGKEALIVLIDGEKEQIESFVRFLKENRPENAVVEGIRVEEYHGTVRDIERFRASFTSTHLSKIIQVGLVMVEKQDETISIVRDVSSKMDLMLKKQDETIAAVKEVKKAVEEVKIAVEEVKEGVNEVKKAVNEVKETVKEVRDGVKEVSSKIDRTNELLEKRFQRLEEEVEKIKKALLKAGIEV
ncbi:MAG: acylphosphatase [Archaeoglobus sp.]|nr:acylphosphatase [Archaeoglobus sp.]